jgi:hypothetical protein
MAVLDKIATKRIVKWGTRPEEYNTFYDYKGVSIHYEEGLDDVWKKPYVKLQCEEKMKGAMNVEKAIGGSSMFLITVDVGQVPKNLRGHYTGLSEAVRAVFDYLASMRPTQRKRIEENIQRKEAAKQS